MPLPKRIYLENHPYFVVFNTYHRVPLFTSEICCDILIENLKFYRNKYHFKFLGFSIIPCHFLGIFLPQRPKDISQIISDIKNYTRKIILEKIKNEEIQDYCFPCGQRCFCEIYPESQLRWDSAVTRSNTRNIGVPSPMGMPAQSTRYGYGFGIPRIWQLNSSLRELFKPNTIWQRRFWDHVIRNELDFNEKLDYINSDAVKHELVDDPVDYKYCSARNCYLGDNSAIKIDKIT